MKYKEFVKWCNDRASDGCWGMAEAMTCINIMDTVNKKPFWKREKVWKDRYEQSIVNNIIIPTNKLIEKYLGDKNAVIQNS